LAFRPFRGGSRIAPLIATIAISFMLYQAALGVRYITNIYIVGEHRSVPGQQEFPRIRLPNLLPDDNILALLGIPLRVNVSVRDVLVVCLAIGLTIAVTLFLQRTRLGRMLRACAEDADMARLCGVDRDGAIRLAFALGGALAGAAAFAFAIYYGNPYTQYGAQSSLVAFTAAILGGIGRPRGALLAGLLLGVLSAYSDFFFAAQWTSVLLMVVTMLVLLVRPRGISDEGSSDEGQSIQTEALGTHDLRAERHAPTVLIVLLSLALIYPFIDSVFNLRLELLASGILISVLLALGLNLVLGFGGMIDLGYAAFFGVGSYAAGLLTIAGGPWREAFGSPPDFLLVLAISGGLAGLLGLVNGGLTLRLRGEYLAVTTLAFGQIVPQLARNLDEWTSGARGISALPPPMIFGIVFQSATARYYLLLTIVALIALGSMLLRNSRIGRAWRALSTDEGAAESNGIAVVRARTLAFVLSAMLAGMAGALFANTFSYVDPTQTEFQLSALVLAMVVIGGAGSVPGAIIGALAVSGYDRVVIPALGAALSGFGKLNGLPIIAALDLRGLNFFWFGLALYLTIWLRARQRE
jgi:branched-chain amino acid transport system permease protein